MGEVLGTSGFDRRGFLKKVAAVSAFAVPVVATFSMDGESLFAGPTAGAAASNGAGGANGGAIITYGVPYTQIYSIGQPNTTYSLVAGALPPTMVLSKTGTISGIPWEIGPFDFEVAAKNSFGTIDKFFEFYVQIRILSSAGTTPRVTAGQPFTLSLTSQGGTAPYTYGVQSGQLPPGLNLSPAGTISGVTTRKGLWPVVISVNDVNGFFGQFTITFNVD